MSWKAIGFDQPDFGEVPPIAMNPYRLAEANGKIGVYQLGLSKNPLIPIAYDYIERVSVAHHTFFIVGINKKYGVYNSEGKLIVEVIYDKIYIGDNIIIARRGKYRGAYNFEGNHIVPDKYVKIIEKHDVIVAINHVGLIGFYSYDGNHIVPDIYSDYSFVKYDEEGKECIFVKDMNKNSGLYDKQGNIVVTVIYRQITLCENFIIADTDAFSTVYDYDGNMILQESEYQYHSYNGKMIIHGSEEGIKVYDKKGKEVEEGVVYEAIFMTHPEFLAAKKDGHWKILYSI